VQTEWTVNTVIMGFMCVWQPQKEQKSPSEQMHHMTIKTNLACPSNLFIETFR